MWSYPVLDPVSQAYPRVEGRSPTCYSPVRRSCTPKGLTARLACVKHAASVRPEPGSNSPTKTGSNQKPRLTGRGPYHRRSHIKTGTTPPVPNKQARHTVEFSKDTRTPSRSSKPRSGAVFPANPTVHPAQPKVHRGVLRGPVSRPGDRSPRGSFCPASR